MGTKQTGRGIAASMMGFVALATVGMVATTGLASQAEASTLLFDKGSYTYDSGSSLDWLDLTATKGLAPDDVLNNNGVSYVQDGWHYATVSDVRGLFQDAGLTLAASGSNYSQSVSGASPVSGIVDLLNFLGVTFTSVAGAYSDTFTAGYLRAAGGVINYADLEIWTEDGTLWNSNAGIFTDIEQPTAGDFATGNFLVRNHVEVTPPTVTPLPTALPMFAAATGLMGFLGLRNGGWKRRKNGAA